MRSSTPNPSPGRSAPHANGIRAGGGEEKSRRRGPLAPVSLMISTLREHPRDLFRRISTVGAGHGVPILSVAEAATQCGPTREATRLLWGRGASRWPIGVDTQCARLDRPRVEVVIKETGAAGPRLLDLLPPLRLASSCARDRRSGELALPRGAGGEVLHALSAYCLGGEWDDWRRRHVGGETFAVQSVRHDAAMRGSEGDSPFAILIRGECTQGRECAPAGGDGGN